MADASASGPDADDPDRRIRELVSEVERLREQIADLRRCQVALRENERRFRLLAEHTQDLICLHEPDGRYLYVSPSSRRLLGYHADDLLGRDPYEFFHPEDGERIRTESHAQVLEGNIVHSIEYRFRCKDGHYVWLESYTRPVLDDGRNVVLLVTSTRDVTDRRRTEDLLSASVREKEALLQEVHHRVKNNLQVVWSLLDLQAEFATNPEAGRILGDSKDRIRSMALIHEQLYRQRSDDAMVAFRPYVEQLADYLFHAFGADPGRIAFESEVDRLSLDLETAVPCGVLLNELLTNALKHAFPDGRRGTVRVSMRRDREPGMIRLEVRDDGVGMPPELVSGRTASFGMGLVDSLVRQLDGQIRVETGSGVAHVIEFPAYRQGATP